MKIEDILSICDHTLLLQTATWPEIKDLCDDAMKYHTASVCIPPCYVKQAADYMQGRIKVCTVIGFLMEIVLRRQRCLRQKMP